ncbi:membrane-spanning 4-domains subfamily A member 4D-like isoform X1 [Polypterus senegalus]|uniref:membrane-spanning 4-domains subfamily A member 4D-like isoform X1 n=1 Tax=Polypterus senegalus TaxID=55291 RepID=UPI001965EF30|nr:membrane-spanning 4-domains subfamily A member 4D-like isoform X1 [Polypterus senegalus]
MIPSCTPANGMFVITQVTPQNNTDRANAITKGSNFDMMSQQLQWFLKGEPKALGAVQIMIGLLSIALGIILEFYDSIAATAGIAFWPSIMYIISGSLSVFAANKLHLCRVKAAIAINIISTIFSSIGIIIYVFDLQYSTYNLEDIDGYNYTYNYDYNFNSDGYLENTIQSTGEGLKVVLLIFTVLELWVSLITAIVGYNAACGNTETTVVNTRQNEELAGIPVQNPPYSTILENVPVTMPHNQVTVMSPFPPPYTM